MSSDIVERLKDSDGFVVFTASDGDPAIKPDTDLMKEAADEIERLRAGRSEWWNAWRDPDGTEWCTDQADSEKGWVACQVRVTVEFQPRSEGSDDEQ